MTPWTAGVASEPMDDVKDTSLVRAIADFVVWFVASHYASPSQTLGAERESPRRRARSDRSTTSA